ncbi:putative transposase [Neisseria meningitidis 4119]|nr:putative transposase [Neisseria meningitidis 4119]
MRKSRLSQYKQNKLIELFVTGVTARTAAELVGVNKNTAAYYFHRLRLLIYQNSPHLEMFDGEVEADESYFGGQREAILMELRTFGIRQNVIYASLTAFPKRILSCI